MCYKTLAMQTDNSQIEFKKEIKAKLKELGKNYKWLALNIGKAAGSVKNWLHTPLPITEENCKKIKEVFALAEAGKTLLDVPDKRIGYLSFSHNSPKEARILIKKYLGITGGLNNLADWVTNEINAAVKSVLGKNVKESNVPKESWTGHLMTFFSDDILSCDSVPSNSKFLVENNVFYIPVIKDYYQAVFVSIAAGITGSSVADWVLNVIEKAYQKKMETLLDELVA